MCCKKGIKRLKCENKTDSTRAPLHQSLAEGKCFISKRQMNLQFPFCRLHNSDCTLRFPFKAADRVTHHPHLKLLYWRSERGVFFSWNIWIRSMHRQSRQCWQQAEGRWPSHGEAQLVLRQTLTRFFSLSCLDCLTPGLSSEYKTCCSKIYCCSLCIDIKQDTTSSRQII